MSCFQRPSRITCACGTVVKVGPKGMVPWRCRTCVYKHKLARARGETPPSRPAHLVAAERSEELGPARPLLGLTAAELSAWRHRRIVELYQREPELSVDALCERFDVSKQQVLGTLQRAGIRVQGNGRTALPAGLPAR
ncbi:hypothetical protein CYFUS_006614 [Cystobacter fuscus]|uniref:Uncharacterized protein n=1 Tax=Cystobacter fuscus TaxID=43 RepID=A0A250JCE7_9BACT|nr:hypothetical protein [Cystobacter fuscus]ATB41152.1 hypothetical protein CYFUS_006614 [Cystobacter fuscus]